MMRLNEKTARDAKDVCAALGDALLPPLIGIVIEYRWIDVAVIWAAANDDDEEHYDIYFRSCDPMLFEFAAERGITGHIVAGIHAADCILDPSGSWVYFVDRFSRQIAALAKNGWYDVIDIFIGISPDGMLELSQCLLPSIMRNPPGDKKRYAELLLEVVTLGTYDGRYEDFDTTRDAIVEGIAVLPESHRAATVDALEEIEELYNCDDDDARSLGSLIAELRGAAAD